MDAVCSVCFKPTRTRAQPCDHPICEPCALRWFLVKPTCPTCRGTVLGISPSSHRTANVKKVAMPKGETCIGVTVCSLPSGVVVRQVQRDSVAHTSGLRCGDVMTHVNGIPINEARHALTIFSKARECQVPVECTIRKTSRRKTLWKKICMPFHDSWTLSCRSP